MSGLKEKLQETKSFLRTNGVENVDFALILGSGLGELAEEIENKVIIKYEGVPHFPTSTVEGHAGQLVYGELSGKKVLAMQGRFHYYEGYPMNDVTYPIRVFAEIGVHSVIVTNAAGGVDDSFKAGDLMLITDHINYTGTNPLFGPNEESIGPRFPDMSEAYNKAYGEITKKVAKNLKIDLKEGVYVGFTGPSYETPAEIRFVRTIGGSAVGMSTVPEVIVAVHSGLRVLGISCITNLATGMQKELNHEEVVETTQRVKDSFKSLIRETLKNL